MFNLVHVHVNDKSDEISFDVSHMAKVFRPSYEPNDRIVYLPDGQISLMGDLDEDEDELYQPYMVFQNDIMGRPLRYKVLVRDMAIKKVMYNRGDGIEDVPF